MEKQETDKINAFDSLYTTNQIQLFKVLLSYMNPSVQKDLVIYIKLMELQYTITFFRDHPFAAFLEASQVGNADQNALFDEIIPFCDMSQRSKILQIKNMMQSMEQMKEMMDVMDMMKEMFPEGMGGSGEIGAGSGDKGSSGPGGLDLSQLFGMMGGNMPDMSAINDMMDLFGTMQAASHSDSNTASPE